MSKFLYDPWLVAVGSQIVGGILSGLIVYHLTQNQSRSSAEGIEALFKGRVKVPRKLPLQFLLNWRYFIFYLIILSGIIGLTLNQSSISTSWYRIVMYVVLVTWWAMIALSAFILMDGAVLEGHLPNVFLLFISIVIPIIGHTKAVVYVLFTFVIKLGLSILFYGAFSKFSNLNTTSFITTLLVSFSLVDIIFYSYLFLPQYPEFANWREGRFIINEFYQ